MAILTWEISRNDPNLNNSRIITGVKRGWWWCNKKISAQRAQTPPRRLQCGHVHGNGNNWDPMGPMGFLREWEWQWLRHGNGSGNKSTGMGVMGYGNRAMAMSYGNGNEFPLQLFNVSYEILFSNTWTMKAHAATLTLHWPDLHPSMTFSLY